MSSQAWRYFEKLPENKAKCKDKKCSKTVSTNDGSTKSLWSHLEHKHKEIYEKLKPKKKAEENNNIEKFVIKKDEQLEADELIASIMVRRNESFYFVEDEGVKQLFKNAYPNLNLRGRTYFRETVIPNMANKIREKILKAIGSNFYSITSDGWSQITKSPSLQRKKMPGLSLTAILRLFLTTTVVFLYFPYAVDGYSIRRMTLNDVDVVKALQEECLPERYPRSDFVDYAKNWSKYCYVAEEDGAIIGFVLAKTYTRLIHSDYGEIHSLGVWPGYRRQGVGRALMNAAHAAMEQENRYEYVKLQLRPQNSGGLYETLGYMYHHTISRYYRDGTDAYEYRMYF